MERQSVRDVHYMPLILYSIVLSAHPGYADSARNDKPNSMAVMAGESQLATISSLLPIESDLQES